MKIFVFIFAVLIGVYCFDSMPMEAEGNYQVEIPFSYEKFIEMATMCGNYVNEEFGANCYDDDTPCGQTCRNRWYHWAIKAKCTKVCGNGCRCKDGYARNYYKQCVQPWTEC
ncbi:PREDICTED: uncharacterized protein LOC105458220 [Wasmannia auropunctata]|uniref:uncharacterized protein LOC105458220 n=1 Tax=Wasmannia auropunctata TaxID=64793 RepID=UPI0005EFCD86|nr:PREDICTED: uncharacterized protein LOC105458220 [Wasmannia auropunctata]